MGFPQYYSKKALPVVLQYCDMHFYSDCTDYNPKFYVQ